MDAQNEKHMSVCKVYVYRNSETLLGQLKMAMITDDNDHLIERLIQLERYSYGYALAMENAMIISVRTGNTRWTGILAKRSVWAARKLLKVKAEKPKKYVVQVLY